MVTTPAPGQPSSTDHGAVRAWMDEALDRGIQPDQALALIGFGLLGRMAGAAGGGEASWEHSWSQLEDGDERRLLSLRRRLETIALAIDTGAPLTTAEVTDLLGARPGSHEVRRGSLVARRHSRNVWRLSRAEPSASDREGFQPPDGFRRRL
jgi:hypothetical protein